MVVVTHEENIAAFTDRIIRFQDGVVLEDTKTEKKGEESIALIDSFRTGGSTAVNIGNLVSKYLLDPC